MGDNLKNSTSAGRMETPVVIKQEIIAPTSPTQTILYEKSRGGGGDSPEGGCNIRLAPLQKLIQNKRESNSATGNADVDGRRPYPEQVDDSSAGDFLALVPLSSNQDQSQAQSSSQLCQWREWRQQCRGRGVRDKLKFALEHDDFYKDVKLIVGKDRVEIRAHKLILRLGSPVFESIMEGLKGTSESRKSDGGAITDILEIPEVEPFPFRQLLQYMYTDDFGSENLKCSDLMVILQAARRFQVQDLAMLCIQALKHHINDETAISLCEMGKDVEDLELRDMALSYICRNPKKIFFSSNFMDLSYKNLVLLIERDDLEWDEISIFKSILRWADEFCRRRGLEPVANNLRGALGEIIYRIRFPVMSAIEFTFEVIPLKVLTSEEQVQVFKYLCLTETSTREQLQLEPTSFNCKKRSHAMNKIEDAIKDEDSLLMKIKSESPHCQPSLASASADYHTETESEDTNSQISSCHSSSVVSATAKSSHPLKRRRSSSPLQSRSGSPSFKKKHATLFGEVAPKRSKEKGGGKRKTSIDIENTVEMENCEIEFNQFIQECANNPRRKEIESIKLSKVSITDHENIPGKKVRLPKLKDFHLDIKIPSLKHKEVNALASEMTLEDYLFFIVKVGKKWSLSEIWSLGINISFIINGITLIKIDHGRKVLVVNKLKDCTKILESLEDDGTSSGIRSLVISQPSFPGNIDLYPTSSLERLVLLVDKIPEFNSFTRKFKRLRELCISSSDSKTMDLSRDLCSTSRDRLRKLAIASVTLSTNALSNNGLKSLEEIFLFRCDWESSFEDCFPTLFPNLKRAYFFLGHKLTAKLLSKLFQMKSVTEIGCGSFDWDSSGSEKTEGRFSTAPIDVLQSAGLTQSDKSFVLTKEGDGNKGWVGKKGSMDLSQEEIFKNFQFYHIYSDYALFRS